MIERVTYDSSLISPCRITKKRPVTSAIGRIRTVAGKRRNGEIFPIELSVTQVASGAQVNYAAFIRDVSAKAKHLRDLAENARLASIGATVSKLTHELGSPLNGMYITAQLLRGILINQIVPADLPSVIADADKLKQVFLNLCNNAVDAMPNGGELTLHASSDDHQAIVEVADTGAGIPEGVDIWAPFATTKSSGTGLGLMIAQNIVMAHQGTIDYMTESGKGTTFRLTLPLSTSHRSAVN